MYSEMARVPKRFKENFYFSKKKHPKWMKLGGLTKSTIQKSLLKQF